MAKTVFIVQPFDFKIYVIFLKFSIGINIELFLYAIIINGKIISFAGMPKKNAVKIFPSRFINLPNGSKKFIKKLKNE